MSQDSPSPTVRVFELAISLIGSVEIVAAHVGITPEDLLAYGTDSRAPPPPVFDRVLTLVLDIQQRRIEDYRDRLARLRRGASVWAESGPGAASVID